MLKVFIDVLLIWVVVSELEHFSVISTDNHYINIICGCVGMGLVMVFSYMKKSKKK